MATKQPEFVEKFDVQGATSEVYINFIDSLRRQTEDGQTINKCRKLCPQPQGNTPATRFFDIVFSTYETSVTVRFRRDNLSVVGFMGLEDKKWYEYGRNPTGSDKHLIQGSTFLGFPGTYNRETLPSIVLSRRALVTVVNELGITTDADVRRNGMTVISLTISEAVRLNRVLNHVTVMFAEDAQGGIIPKWMPDLVRAWAPLSRALSRANQGGNDFTFPTNDANITTFANAAREIGMVLTEEADTSLKGRPLVEVFRVDITDRYGGNPADKFYGTIRATDGLSSQYLSNVAENDPHEAIILTGPSRSMCALGNFNIDISLTNKDTNWPINGQMNTWDASNNVTNVYDKVIDESVNCGTYNVDMNYIIFQDAVQATIQVTLIGLAGYASYSYDFWGTIGADSRTTKDTTLLFDRPVSTGIQVYGDQIIPLRRAVVAVPLDGILEVSADIYRKYAYNGTANHAASGKVLFEAEPSGTSENIIKGPAGEVHVTVTWS